MTNGHRVIATGVVIAGLGAIAFGLSKLPPLPEYVPSEQVAAADCPAATAYVQDCADLLDADQQAILEKLLSDYDASTTNQIAVVTVNSLNGRDIESYSIKLAEELKVGRADVDNGVIFLIAKNDRKMRIEVGHGLEGHITDAQAGNIIRDRVAPFFKSSDFPGGIMAGVDAIQRQIDSVNAQ